MIKQCVAIDDVLDRHAFSVSVNLALTFIGDNKEGEGYGR